MMHDDSFDDFHDLELADEVDFLRASHRNLDAHLSDRVFAVSETDDTHQSGSEGFRELLDEETSLNRNAAASARLGAMAKAKPQSASSSGQNDSLLSGNFNCDIVVAHALNSLEPDRVEHFWEKGFWSNVFTDGNPVDSMFPKGLKRPLAFFEPSMDGLSEDAVDVVREPKFVSGSCHYSSVISSSLQSSWRDEREAKWESAIRRWHSLVMSWNSDAVLIRTVLSGETFKEQSQVLVDVFYNKAPATLLKRCSGLNRITCDLNKLGIDFPCSEPVFYDFMCRQRAEGAPASRLKSCFESVVFCRHVLGLSELDDCINSRRCLGVTARSIHDKVRQASPLRVEHLQYLHKRIHTDPDVWNKAFIGMVFFCTYGRSRWSDAQHGEKIIDDRDDSGKLIYIEVETGVHKTARAMHMKFVFLPLVAPCIGIDNTSWGEAWLSARRELGIESLKDFPLMPAPDAAGVATVRPVSTEEAGRWLRMLLKDGSFDLESLKISSHTMKCTFLSFLAKRGISLEDRRILGYHTDGNKVPLTYSRDAASRPLAILEGLISEIYHDKFRPDSTRSGRLVTRTDNDVSAVKVEDDFIVVADSPGAEESDGHVTTDSSDSEGEVPPKDPKLYWNKHEAPDGTELWHHTKLKTLHLTYAGNKVVFICNRTINANYERCTPYQRYDTPRCKCCFNRKNHVF